jgi:Spy/CpxP family protein refolding chaperone
MSERLETLNKARARMIEDREMHAKVLAAPFDRDKAERARNKFIEIQALIDALDRHKRRGGHFAKKLNQGGSDTPHVSQRAA